MGPGYPTPTGCRTDISFTGCDEEGLMALVVGFEQVELKRPKTHRTKVTCYWATLHSDDKGPLIQLDTRGSDEREIPGKLSQTLQLSKNGAEELISILRREF